MNRGSGDGGVVGRIGRMLAASGAGLAVVLASGTVAPASAAPSAGAAATTASAAPAAPAAGDRTTWSIQPSTAKGPDKRTAFDYTLKPGARVSDYVGVTNLGTTPVTLRLYAADARNDSTGVFDLDPGAVKPVDVGGWVALRQGQITIPARTRADVPFTLKVPDDASPGDHVGGVVASLTSTSSDAAGNTVRQERRVGARIYLRVDGPARPALSVRAQTSSFSASGSPFDGGGLQVTYTVRNTGNVRLTGTPQIHVGGPVGLDLGDYTQDRLPELLPGNSVTVTRRVQDVAPLVRVSVRVSVQPELVAGAPGASAGAASGESAQPALPRASATVHMWAWSWYLLAPLAVLLILAALIWRFAGPRIRQWWRQSRHPADQPGDTATVPVP